ncbi:protein FAR1-RELATED SEQUENCE 5-like [Citrus sinensis]|uniref:protein FAR1-RELATED SEQUENCE 5-like n=1 Tax=Citrus clementina TaxID=85681 RepID=UPI000CECE83A|nr:protein FAR1-RELATED SEQUENCE 5-like [Citrus x clementina]XP_052288604.1 protein FAR1-RELATED SEQUENCE 5-like [Citrus sinensis]
MSFAPFIGVNYHGHSILFGCGLISHEDIETFTWLLRTWLSYMSNSDPIRIITDQDRAIKVAIQNVFPNTRHRWCLWHIMKKIPEKLGAYKEYRDISNVLHCVVYDSQNAAKFEETWHHMIVEYDLEDKEWLRGLYDERHHWVPCYLNNNFWAGMSSTQRSESMNAFFYGYVNSKTTLKQFVEQYNCTLKNEVQKEVEEDVRCLSQQMPCVTSYAMERQIRDVYTISKFQELIRKIYCEFVNSMGYEYIVREDVKVGEGFSEYVLVLLLKKPSSVSWDDHDNVLLVQELVHDLNFCTQGNNVVLKLDMAKAYNQMSWSFIAQMLRCFGFSEWWVSLIR